MSTAKIQNINGTPTITINEQPFSLMAMTTRIGDEEYIKELRRAGIRIFFVREQRWSRQRTGMR